MKYIVKSEEPGFFTEWKRQNCNAVYTDLHKSENHDTYLNLKQNLKVAQGWICCYCGDEIDMPESHHYRVLYPSS